MNDDRRKFVNELLRWDKRSIRDLEKISRLLRHEPEALVRRLRSQAIICLDDVMAYSKLLKGEFPELVYFFANYKTDSPTPDKFSDGFPIAIYETLLEGVEAAIEVGKERPSYNGPNFNRPNIVARWPWPEELASGNPEKLIGGREFPDSTFDLALQYRDLGRWFMFHYRTKGYLHPRLPANERKAWILDEAKLSDQQYMPFQVLDSAQSEFFTLYDLNDEETRSFAKRAHSLWRRIYTKKVAHYDPATGRVVQPAGWDGKFSWNVGKQALINALSDSPRYAGFAPRPAPDGSPLMLGPVAKLR